MPDAPDAPAPDSRTRRPIGRGARTLLVIAAGLVGAALFGTTNLLASLRDGSPADGVAIGVAAAFALNGAAFGALLAWVFLFGRHRPEARAAAAKDSIERSLQQRAASGAFADLVIVAGLANVATGLLALEWTATAALSVVTAIGLADFVTRYLVLQRRES